MLVVLTVIIVKNLCKTFRIPHAKKKTLYHNLLSLKSGGYEYEQFFALNDISFRIEKGEFVGIIGRNGSGKSTLLKLMASIYKPTSGSVVLNEEIYPMLELGVGFQFDFTVRENIYIYGALLGFHREEMEMHVGRILAFSELDRFADAKLEKLSTGMQMRLGFAIAIQSVAPIMLVDEVLAVGDQLFREKCTETFNRLKADGATILLVSHDQAAIQEHCTRVLVMDGGRLVYDGPPSEAMQYYESQILHAS